MPLALAAAERAGMSCILLNVRGADRSGEDISHAGLTEDLQAVFQSPLLAAYRRIYLLGYSLGGHLALRYATEAPDPRLRGVVAVSSPLDLDAAAQAFDRSRWSVYRHHVLAILALCLLAAVWPAIAIGRAEPLRLLQAGRGTM